MVPSFLKSILFTSFLLFPSLAFPAVDLGFSVQSTPYEPHMRIVKEVFQTMNDSPPPLARVTALLRQGHAFRYSHSTAYTPASPEATAARQLGDCKDKALWLCNQLQDPSARFVIGKIHRGNRLSHAWVLWRSSGSWWILDCTLHARPIPADSLGPDAYLPLYSYSKNQTFRHEAADPKLTVSTPKPSSSPET
ncbi:MAG: hypothetical protein WCI46_13425 [Verrucomicrobiota bacterium]